jgi:hypothetical protein
LLGLGFELEQAISMAQALMAHVLKTSYQWPLEEGPQEIHALNQLPPKPANFFEGIELE